MPCRGFDAFIEGTMDCLHYVVVIQELSSFRRYIESSDLLRASLRGSGRYQALALRLS